MIFNGGERKNPYIYIDIYIYILPKLPVTAVRTSLSIWYFSLWSSCRIFSSTYKRREKLNKERNLRRQGQELRRVL